MSDKATTTPEAQTLCGLLIWCRKNGFRPTTLTVGSIQIHVDDLRVEDAAPKGGPRNIQEAWEQELGFKPLPADTDEDDPKYRLLKKMEQQTFRASHLVNNLLDLIANRPRSREIVNIDELVAATVALHEDLFKAKRIHVHVRTTPSRVRGNFHDLQQVLTNILLNARDAVGEGGNIWVSVAEEQDRVVIRVKDDGKGISADMIGRIFEPLVTTKRGQGGTGLGLAISRRIIHASNGEIDVASTPGSGAEFSITLPRVEKLVGSMQ